MEEAVGFCECGGCLEAGEDLAALLALPLARRRRCQGTIFANQSSRARFPPVTTAPVASIATQLA